MIVLAVAAAAVCANAASVVWNSGTVLDPNGDTANKSVTAYLWVIDATTYATYSGITDGAAMSTKVYEAYGSSTATAYASGTTNKKGVINLTDDSKSYSEGNTAYAVILYTYGSGDEMKFMGNAGAVTLESALDAESGYMSENLLGSATAAATAWSSAAVPEPTSGLLMLLGVAGLALRRRRA